MKICSSFAKLPAFITRKIRANLRIRITDAPELHCPSGPLHIKCSTQNGTIANRSTISHITLLLLSHITHESQTDPMSEWTCTQLCEFEYDTVLCADARVLLEQHFIESLRAAGYNDMLMRNNALCKDTRRRAQMARWRVAHPGYMSAAARHHKELREQKLHEQQQAQAETAQEEPVPTENAQDQTVPMDTETGEQ
eukprot:COSAG02_NODE_884_length_16193_cov_20.464086_15_plen_196_part_00